MKLILKSGLLAAMVFALVGPAVSAHAYPNVTLNACAASKTKCVIKMKSCTLGCYNKSIGKGLPVDTVCLDKCRNGFFGDPAIGKGCIEKADAKGGCVAGSGPVLRSKVSAQALDLVGQMVPGGGNPLNKCTAGKIKCVLKYDACVLGIVAKAFKAGGAVGVLDKCTAILTNNFNNNGKASCVGKLETKYAVDTPCLTFNDQGGLRTSDDAFVADVINDLEKGSTNHNNKRCTGDTAVQCVTTAPDCAGAGGTCEVYFGSPLPLAAGGIPSCVTNQWNGTIAGTFNQQSGASAGNALLLSRVYTGGNTVDAPCPKCVGDPFPNDNSAGGACAGGQHPGAACDANGLSPVPSFGSTSLDCGPGNGTIVATLPVDLTNTNTGTMTKTLVAGSPNCTGAAGLKCLCSTCSGNASIACLDDAPCIAAAAGTCTVGIGPGTPRQPNACIDDTATGPDETHVCTPTAGGEGECVGGPVTQHCAIENFRGCLVDTDCPATGDTCASDNRECFPGYNGVVGNTITAQGTHDAPHNGTGTSTFASIFCVAPTGAPAVNNAAGLPGPGRLQLSGVANENGTTLGVCPTQADFLPTAKGGVLDTGWTGLAHDAKVVGQGKVTVAVTGCAFGPPNCGQCSYTGPIANP